MKIDKFTNDSFGSLTTITSEQTGVVMFLGKQIAELWGHTNLTQALKAAALNDNEYKVVKLAKFKDFKKQLTNSGLVGERTSNITLLTESGMYRKDY
jgi:prophage antirepressor-like protein